MVREATSASGAARLPTARAVHTLLRTAMKSDDCEHIAERRSEAAEALHSALGELESGNALSEFVEGHGLHAITDQDGDEIDSCDDWQPLIARLENDIPAAGESLRIIWP